MCPFDSALTTRQTMLAPCGRGHGGGPWEAHGGFDSPLVDTGDPWYEGGCNGVGVEDGGGRGTRLLTRRRSKKAVRARGAFQLPPLGFADWAGSLSTTI